MRSPLSGPPPPQLQNLHFLPSTIPLTPVAAVLPPLLYFLALLLLPPFEKDSKPWAPPILISSLRNCLAIFAAGLFIRLPNAYHVPGSAGLTYILALIGIYGFCRIVDAFFISKYWFHHVPKRVTYHHALRNECGSDSEMEVEDQESLHADKEDGNGDGNGYGIGGGNKDSDGDGDGDVDREIGRRRRKVPKETKRNLAKARPAQGPDADSYFSIHFLKPASGTAVTETAQSDEGWPKGIWDRASWAIEFETSMRGAGFQWTTADVRHTKRTWRPTVKDRFHSIIIHVGPVVLLSWSMIRFVWQHYLDKNISFDECPYGIQAMLTLGLGGFLMASFSFGHSLSAILLSVLNPHPLAYFPPLYTLRVWEITSVRSFWSYGWHRLFARLFLVWGTWPGEWLERQILRKSADQPADAGKVLGAFLSSAFVHAFASHTVMPNGWRGAAGDAWFFAGNGFAVVIEEFIWRIVKKYRRSQKRTNDSTRRTEQHGGQDRDNHQSQNQIQNQNQNQNPDPLHRWYDGIVGRIWWISILLYSGRNFVRGWVAADLVTEISLIV